LLTSGQSYSPGGANVHPHLVHLNRHPHRTGSAPLVSRFEYIDRRVCPGPIPFRPQNTAPSRSAIYCTVPWAQPS